MPSPCPICNDRKFRKTFDELIAAGGDLTAAKKLCENELILPEGKICSAYRIKVHATMHSKLEPDRLHESFLKAKRPDPVQVAAERRDREVTSAVVESYLDEVGSIDIDGVLASLGIKGKPGSMGDVLTLAQEMSVGINLLAGAIAVDRLRKFSNDPEGRRYPSVELKGAAMAAEMMSAAFGYSQAISVQSAVDTVERAGYEVIERGTNDKQALAPGG
jgi:hypothetical protein